MKSKTAQFRVDPRLTTLLGETYRSTEHAIKELIDNAWDADSERVWITLPAILTDEPVIIRDDGTGMTEHEIRHEYLKIANDRRSRKGELTIGKKRTVKGRKGIGKFAGLIAADVMEVLTRCRGVATQLRVVKEDILHAPGDLERVDLPLSVDQCDAQAHGTTVTLSCLNTNFILPQAEKLRELLALEYGRERDFLLFVNDEQLAHEDIPGQRFSATVQLPNAGRVTINFTIMEKPAQKSQAGIVMRVGGKVVGQPTFLGLEEEADLPSRLLRYVVGEVIADSLEGDVTADWGAIIENSVAYDEARKWIRDQVGYQVRQKFRSDIEEQIKQRERVIEQRIARLPEHRRQIARRELERVFKKFYGDSEERIDAIVSLMLDMIEKDEYWLVCDRLNQARTGDVEVLATALEEFGLVDLAVIAQQAGRRLELLDRLDELASKPNTLEMDMHTALEKNLWVFGAQYSVMASNQSLARVISEYTGRAFKGARGRQRPDLFLAHDAGDRHLLIEFKRPTDQVGRDAEAQAKKYRDDLTPNFGHIRVFVVGGEVDPTMSAQYVDADLQFLSYDVMISRARNGLGWLLKELTTPSTS
jgi:hypothetical protein